MRSEVLSSNEDNKFLDFMFFSAGDMIVPELLLRLQEFIINS